MRSLIENFTVVFQSSRWFQVLTYAEHNTNFVFASSRQTLFTGKRPLCTDGGLPSPNSHLRTRTVVVVLECGPGNAAQFHSS